VLIAASNMAPVWIFLGLLLIGFVVGMTVRYQRKRSWYRKCPRCGVDVRVGTLECRRCGFDLGSVGSSS